jgi:hypothetical protein
MKEELQIQKLDASQFYQTGVFMCFYRHLLSLTVVCYRTQYSFARLVIHILQLAHDSRTNERGVPES